VTNVTNIYNNRRPTSVTRTRPRKRRRLFRRRHSSTRACTAGGHQKVNATTSTGKSFHVEWHTSDGIGAAASAGTAEPSGCEAYGGWRDARLRADRATPEAKRQPASRSRPPNSEDRWRTPAAKPNVTIATAAAQADDGMRHQPTEWRTYSSAARRPRDPPPSLQHRGR
jgi:hypothetical protein